jgi:hypothetical protein
MVNEETSRKQSTNKIPLIRTEGVVKDLKKMPDGWAGNMSKKPTTKAVNKVKKVLAILESGRMPWPTITVIANGGVMLTWLSTTKDILLTVDTVGDIQFATSHKKIDSASNEVVDRLDSEGSVTDMKALDYMMAWYAADTASAC